MSDKSGGNKEKKGSGSNVSIKILTFVLVGVLVAALFFYSVINGIVGTIVSFVDGLAGQAINTINKLLGTGSEYDQMQTYILDEETVENLKQTFESVGIHTDGSGLTEVRLRKILLANISSTSFSDTLCAVPIPGNENEAKEYIVANEKEKDDDIKTFNDFKNKAEKKRSWNDEIWPISDPNYDLYYSLDSTKFFYFKDTKNVFEDDGTDNYTWYIGIMGAMTITTDEGSNLEWRSRPDFEHLPEQYVGNEQELLRFYTKLSSDEIRVYTVSTEQKTYDYKFENDNLGGDNPLTATKTGDEVVTVGTEDISLSRDINVQDYVISNELMLDLMDVTGSGEFLEAFIDYAIEKIDIKIVAYQDKYEEYTYDTTTFNVNKNSAIAEAYDMIKLVDDRRDNFQAYKEIIFDRIYNGSYFSGSVVTLGDLDQIDYDGESNTNEGEEEGEEGEDDEVEEYNVAPLGTYLDVAYEGVSSEMKVTEMTTTYKTQTKCEIVPSTVDTWYGTVMYSPPEQIHSYIASNVSGEISEEEYNNFTFNENGSFTHVDNIVVTAIYVAIDFANDTGIHASGSDNNKVEVISQHDNDIANKILWASDEFDGSVNDSNNKTIFGILQVGRHDGGEYNGALDESNYIYSKFTKENIKQFAPQFKAHNMTWDTTNVTQTAGNIEAALTEFLALLKNERGEQTKLCPPQYKSDDEIATFDSSGKVVYYGDIYKGTIPAGDLLLDNGAEMLFDLLESFEGTQKLVNVFKFMAYIYNGKTRDYGITDESQLNNIFSTTRYFGSDDYIVNTGMSSQDIVLDKDKLEEAIKSTYSGRTRDNLLSCLDDFMYIQDTYKVNAVFAVSVTIIESGGGTSWDLIDPSTHNWYSIKGSYNGNYYTDRNGTAWKSYPSLNEAVRDFGNLIANGSYYFKNGKNTVKAIAPTYCNDNWGISVVAEMTKIFNSVGISTVPDDAVPGGGAGGTEGTAGSYTTFTTGGRTYKNYKQIIDSYRSIPLACYPDTTLYMSGCAITSDAIIATGFGHNVTPVDVNRLGSNNHPSIVSRYSGMNCSWNHTFTKDGVVRQLQRGLPVMLHVGANSGRWSTGYGHFFVALGISEDGQNVYISDPASYRNTRTGWLPISVLSDRSNGFDEYMVMN